MLQILSEAVSPLTNRQSMCIQLPWKSFWETKDMLKLSLEHILAEKRRLTSFAYFLLSKFMKKSVASFTLPGNVSCYQFSAVSTWESAWEIVSIWHQPPSLSQQMFSITYFQLCQPGSIHGVYIYARFIFYIVKHIKLLTFLHQPWHCVFISSSIKKTFHAIRWELTPIFFRPISMVGDILSITPATISFPQHLFLVPMLGWLDLGAIFIYIFFHSWYVFLSSFLIPLLH